MRVRGPLLAVVACGWLAGAAAAQADTAYCVPATTIAGCPSGATAKPTIAAALVAVGGDGGAHDTVLIGPGTYPEGGLSSSAAVTITGAGVGQTVISPPGASPTTTLALSSPNSLVQGLTIGVAAGANNTGLSLAGQATNVAITAGVSSTSPVGVANSGSGTLTHASVTLPSPSVGLSGAITTFHVSDTTVQAGIGFQGTGTIARSRILATTGVTPNQVFGGFVQLDDSLVVTTPGSGSEAAVLLNQTGSPTSFGESAALHHDTLIGDGSAGSSGIACTASAMGGPAAFTPASCSVTADSMIIRGFDHAINRVAAYTACPSGSMFCNDTAASATVAIDYSDLDPSTDMDTNSGGGTGQITLGTHDVNVDPQFAGSGAQPFALTRRSALIDAGNPTLATSPAESTTDLAGAPRAVPGSAGQPARSDIGALEYQPSAPSVRLAASAGPYLPAHAITFTATPAEPDPTDAVTVTWSFDDGASASGVSVTHAFAATGTHTATATVTDLGGFTGTARLALLVVAPPKLSGAHLTISGHRVTMSYRDSVAAAATLVLERATPGVKSGRRCLAPPRHRRGRPRTCVRWLTVRTIHHADRAGSNSVRLGQTLPRGSYRVILTARTGSHLTASLTVSFTIRAR